MIVDVGGVGYGVFMPEASMGMLPQMGEEIKLHTYLNVREDAMQLFGFLTRDDLEAVSYTHLLRRQRTDHHQRQQFCRKEIKRKRTAAVYRLKTGAFTGTAGSKNTAGF